MAGVANHVLEVDVGQDDAALFDVLRKAPEGATVALISGDLGGRLAASARWLGLMMDMPLLPIVVAEGEIGMRGLALLLAADMAIIGPDAAWAGLAHWDLAELTMVRLGPLGARQVGLSDDPVAALVSLGHLEPHDAPMAAARQRAQILDNALRLRMGWRAARDLPCGEALEYGGWFSARAAMEGN